MTSYLTLYATCATAAEAALIARTLVEEGLVACVNILPEIQSVYRWQGKLEEGTETPILAKTTADLADSAIARINALHSYDCPCVVAWPIAKGHGPYLDWITQTVGLD